MKRRLTALAITGLLALSGCTQGDGEATASRMPPLTAAASASPDVPEPIEPIEPVEPLEPPAPRSTAESPSAMLRRTVRELRDADSGGFRTVVTESAITTITGSFRLSTRSSTVATASDSDYDPYAAEVRMAGRKAWFREVYDESFDLDEQCWRYVDPSIAGPDTEGWSPGDPIFTDGRPEALDVLFAGRTADLRPDGRAIRGTSELYALAASFGSWVPDRLGVTPGSPVRAAVEFDVSAGRVVGWQTPAAALLEAARGAGLVVDEEFADFVDKRPEPFYIASTSVGDLGAAYTVAAPPSEETIRADEALDPAEHDCRLDFTSSDAA